MARAENGSTVKIHYTGRYEDGTVFDSSRERNPLEFTIGEGRTIEGFEESAIGMAPGDTKEITLGPDKAFGERDESMVQPIERSQIPEDIELEVGMPLQVQSPEGETYMVSVVALEGDAV
ncbi:FKBP-type peptidyl-prolyl cis-trans isomerase, partial [bacterium]|nr:FKBP-type peptidyl-prolyl cis-trans isomerase [bacterium]